MKQDYQPCALTKATNSIGRIPNRKFAGFCNRIRHERFGAGVCVYNLKKPRLETGLRLKG